MSLVVEQLIYSSFERMGFKYIASTNVPLSIQQIFYQNVVSRLWDSYSPPAKHHKGVYLYQSDLDKILFGWLRNDGEDEFGRGDIPYFHCYYLNEILDSTRLVKILACLEAGPIERVYRDRPIAISGDVLISDNYQAGAFELGVKLSKDIRLFSHRQLREGKLLQWYVSAKDSDDRQENTVSSVPQTSSWYVPAKDSDDRSTVPPAPQNSLMERETTNSPENRLPLSFSLKDLDDRPENPPPPLPNTSLATRETHSITEIDTSEIGRILLDLMAKPIAIEGVALVSPEGQLLARAIGIEENSSLILSGTLLYLANNTLEELAWDRVEQIAIRSQQGHLVLTACTPEAFLLVKTGKVLSGLLEGEIQKARVRLQPLLVNPSPVRESPAAIGAHLEPKVTSAFDTIFYGFDSTENLEDTEGMEDTEGIVRQ
jgi:predicted regulator of Ras-like GTPase activity (Roadblock/LC7/MglB family)